MASAPIKRHLPLIIAALLVVFLLVTFFPAMAQASSSGPRQSIPGWLQEALDSLETALVKTLQDTARVGGVLFWGVLKVCGLVGLFGDGFSTLFGTVVTEALDAVVEGVPWAETAKMYPELKKALDLWGENAHNNDGRKGE